MRIRNIHLENIRVHKDLHILDLPENGLITISAKNSHGKSSLVGLIIDMLKCNFTTNNACKKYVSYWAEEGRATLECHDGTKVILTLQREASKSFYTIYTPLNDTVTTFGVKDPVLKSVIGDIFNIDTDPDSINFYILYDSKLLGVTTTPTETYKVFKKHSTDEYVEKSLECIKEFTNRTREELRTIDMQIKSREEVLSKEYGDINRMKELHSELSELKKVSDMKPKMSLIPKFNVSIEYNLTNEEEEILLRVPRGIIEKINVNRVGVSIPNSIMAIINRKTTPKLVSKFIDKLEDLPNEVYEIGALNKPSKIPQELYLFSEYQESIEKIKKIEEKECPTCGRLLIDCGGII